MSDHTVIPTEGNARYVASTEIRGPASGHCVSGSKETPIGQTAIHVKGRAVSVPSVEIDGRTVIASNKWLKMASVQDEDLVEEQSFEDPAAFILRLKESKLNADIFTFVQKLPVATPKYSYHLEWNNFAVIPITTYSDWWENRVESSVRRAVRKAAKAGVVVKVSELDDAFVHGIADINNETPVRQGRSFWHFQKSFEAVRDENSTYADRNTFLGAYDQDELIGFIRMTVAGSVAHVVQLLTKMKHYDKRPANALLAKAVEVCEQKGLSHLVYCNYVYNDPKSSLTEFKRRNGFEKVLLPCYYIPLTFKGKVALRLGFHRGLKQLIPKPLLTQLLRIRGLWYARRQKAIEGTL